MNLHEAPDTFSEFVAVTAEHLQLPEVYVEKDYWVTKALKHLSEFKDSDKVVFKGGTSLSKAYKLISRFSEDIDLAVFAQNLNGNQTKDLLKKVESVTSSELTEVTDSLRISKGSKYRKTVWKYPRMVEQQNFGQASSDLLIEINAFTNPEPFESKSLETLISEFLTDEGKSDLIEEFGLQPFNIQVLSVQRTLVEKILGIIRDSYNENPVEKLSNRIRHLYDICLILKQSTYREFIVSADFPILCKICISDDFVSSFGQSDFYDRPLNEAPIFSEFENWKKQLSTVYSGVFADLVYGDLPSIEDIEEALLFIRGQLNRIS